MRCWTKLEYVGGASQDPIQPPTSDNEEGEEDHDRGDDSKKDDSQESKEELQEETDEQELGKLKMYSINYSLLIIYPPVRLQKDWWSAVYAFFHPDINISYTNGRCTYDFTCAAKHCKGRGRDARVVWRYLDTKDSKSTSSLNRHAKICWGEEIVRQATQAGNIESARRALKDVKLIDGSLMAAFNRMSKGKITYSHCPRTKAETWLFFCF